MLLSAVASLLPTVAVLLLASLAAGCGARSSLDDDDTAGADMPRVDDCVRQAPHAVPLARIAPLPEGGGADPFHLSSDEDHLYFASEGRIWRVAKASGAPQALTPAGSAGGRVMVGGGSVFWSKDGQVFRAPVGGGDPELVGTAPGVWTISGQDLVTAGPANEPAPVIRTPFGGGSSQEILPLDPEQFIRQLAPVGDGVLVQRSRDLVLIPASGVPLQLAEGGVMSGGDLAEGGGFVYFGAIDADDFSAGPALLRVAAGGGDASVRLLDGFVMDLALVDDTLYANVVLRRPGDVFVGVVVRLPSSGGAFTAMAKTDAWAPDSSPGSMPVYGQDAGGLAADDDHVYLIQHCTEVLPPEYRLVSLPVDEVISL